MITCGACGWVHAGLTETEWRAMSEEPPWVRCFRCGAGNEGMREYREGDCPVGCTIQPVIVPAHLEG